LLVYCEQHWSSVTPLHSPQMMIIVSHCRRVTPQTCWAAFWQQTNCRRRSTQRCISSSSTCAERAACLSHVERSMPLRPLICCQRGRVLIHTCRFMMTQYVYYRALERHRQKTEAAQLRRQQRHLHYHGLPQHEVRIRAPELVDAAAAVRLRYRTSGGHRDRLMHPRQCPDLPAGPLTW